MILRWKNFFDLTSPTDLRDAYGIALTDASLGQPGNDKLVQILVFQRNQRGFQGAGWVILISAQTSTTFSMPSAFVA